MEVISFNYFEECFFSVLSQKSKVFSNGWFKKIANILEKNSKK